MKKLSEVVERLLGTARVDDLDSDRLMDIAADVGAIFIKHKATYPEIMAVVACVLQVIDDKAKKTRVQ